MPLTFVHTADWHLGHTYWKIGPRAADSREWRFEAVRRIWNLAADKSADFILVGGDVFDSDTPSAATRQAAVELLADAPAPVFLISGNHDPCAEGSVWYQSDFAGAVSGLSNVRLALQPEAVELESGVRLFPCPVTRKYSREDATAWIPEAERGADFRVGLAHGGWRGYFSGSEPQDLNIIDAARSEIAGLDYLALGDYHSYTPPDHAAAKVRTYYAGTPEIGAKDNVRGGHALCVTIDSPGAVPKVEPHFVGRVKLADWGRVTLQTKADLDLLREKVQTITAPEDTLVRATLVGQLSPGVLAELNEWLNELRENTLGVDVLQRDLHAWPELEDFKALNLERVEEALLDLLQEPVDAELLAGIRGGSHIADWSRDQAARRESMALYYRLLRGA